MHGNDIVEEIKYLFHLTITIINNVKNNLG